MDNKKAALLILTRMAISDGKLTDEELNQLHEMIKFFALEISSEELITEAKTSEINALIEYLPKYEDRFFTAMRSYSIAMIDEDFDHQEEILFEELIGKLQITNEDRLLIEESERAMMNDGDWLPPVRLLELYNNSSFAC